LVQQVPDGFLQSLVYQDIPFLASITHYQASVDACVVRPIPGDVTVDGLLKYVGAKVGVRACFQDEGEGLGGDAHTGHGEGVNQPLSQPRRERHEIHAPAVFSSAILLCL
jgi:hypothetical protein